MNPTTAPEGVRTVAVTMSSPTFDSATCSVAPDAIAAATAACTSGTPPVDERAVGRISRGKEAELIAADLVPDIERLVEIRPGPDQRRPPRFGGFEIGSGIDDRAETEE